MSSPRVAISAIWSAVGFVLDIFGIALFSFLGRSPGGNQWPREQTLPRCPLHDCRGSVGKQSRRGDRRRQDLPAFLSAASIVASGSSSDSGASSSGTAP